MLKWIIGAPVAVLGSVTLFGWYVWIGVQQVMESNLHDGFDDDV